MPWRRSQVWAGIKAGWRDDQRDPAVLKIGAALGILAGLGLCVGMMVS